MTDWKDVYNRVVQFTRLETLPIGLKFYEKLEDLPSEKEVKRPHLRQASCVLTNVARLLGRPMIGLPEMADRCSLGTYAFGFGDLGKEFREGRRNLGTYHWNIENNAKFLDNSPHFEKGRWAAFYVAPITNILVEPDIVAFYAMPGQIMKFIQGWVYMGGAPVKALTFGDLACAETWVATYLDDEPRIVVPCNGERVFAGSQSYEMVFSTPAKYVERILVGMEAMHASGFRYPITSNVLDAEPVPPAAWFTRPEDHPYKELGKAGLEVFEKSGIKGETWDPEKLKQTPLLKNY